MSFTCWSPASSCPAPCWRSAARCGTRARRWSSACWPRTWPRCRRERRRGGARGSGGPSSCPARGRRRRRPALPGRSPRPGWSEAAALGVHRVLMLLLQGFNGGSAMINPSSWCFWRRRRRRIYNHNCITIFSQGCKKKKDKVLFFLFLQENKDL